MAHIGCQKKDKAPIGATAFRPYYKRDPLTHAERLSSAPCTNSVWAMAGLVFTSYRRMCSGRGTANLPPNSENRGDGRRTARHNGR